VPASIGRQHLAWAVTAVLLGIAQWPCRLPPPSTAGTGPGRLCRSWCSPWTVTSMSWTTPRRPPAEPDGGVVVQNDCLLAILVPSGRRGAVARRPRPHRAPGTGSTLPTRGVLEPRRSFVRSRSLGAPCLCPTARPPEPEVGEAVFNEGAAPVACATPGWRGREVASSDRLATFPHRPLAAIARLRSGGYAGHVS
jgi:hypothetical protein